MLVNVEFCTNIFGTVISIRNVGNSLGLSHYFTNKTSICSIYTHINHLIFKYQCYSVSIGFDNTMAYGSSITNNIDVEVEEPILNSQQFK